MHEMPDRWQRDMEKLLREYDETWDRSDIKGCKVFAVGGRGRFIEWPEWLLNYRHPRTEEIEARRKK